MLLVLGFIVGIVLGSGAAALADRSIRKTSFWGRSYCTKCKKHLKWYDLFPVFSFLLLKGHCRYCHHSIPLSNLLTEVLVGLAAALVFSTTLPADFTVLLTPNWSTLLVLIELFFKLFLVMILTIVFITDLKTGLILDRITYPAIIITFIYLLTAGGLRSWIFYQELSKIPFGKYLLPPYSTYFTDNLQRLWLSNLGAVASGITASLFFILLIIVTKGKGMGWGDVKFVLLLGLALGFPNIIVGIFLAFLIGAVFSLGLIILKRKHFGQTIPFGPFLSLGAFLALFLGPQIINWYLNSFKLGY